VTRTGGAPAEQEPAPRRGGAGAPAGGRHRGGSIAAGLLLDQAQALRHEPTPRRNRAPLAKTSASLLNSGATSASAISASRPARRPRRPRRPAGPRPRRRRCRTPRSRSSRSSCRRAAWPRRRTAVLGRQGDGQRDEAGVPVAAGEQPGLDGGVRLVDDLDARAEPPPTSGPALGAGDTGLAEGGRDQEREREWRALLGADALAALGPAGVLEDLRGLLLRQLRSCRPRCHRRRGGAGG
jgi:hypothetical protein